MSDNQLNFNKVLRNALAWKQWMVDDLRILIDLVQKEELSDESAHMLISHHLKTYQHVNDVYKILTHDDDNVLFDLPSLEYLKKELPNMKTSEEVVEDIIEPMLELELDGLSDDLKSEIIESQKTAVVDETSKEEEVDDGLSDESEVDSVDDGLADDEDESAEECLTDDEVDDSADDGLDDDEVSISEESVFTDDLEVEDDIDNIKLDEDEQVDTKVRASDLASKIWDDAEDIITNLINRSEESDSNAE